MINGYLLHLRSSLRSLIAALLLVSGAALAQPGYHDPAARSHAYPSSAFGAGLAGGFVENRGQVVDVNGDRRSDILYSVFSGGMRLFARRGGISYLFQSVERVTPPGAGRDGEGTMEIPDIRVTSYRMDVDLVGSNRDATIMAEEPTGHRANFYLSRCPDGITAVPSYRRLIYHDIYPNIDLVFHAGSDGLKYDFVVRPGGDPSVIRLRYTGADTLARTSTGSLRVVTPLGTLNEGAPRSFQGEGEGAREVPCGYRVEGSELRFLPRRHDPGLTLVIDPTLQWATYCGGSELEAALDIPGEDITTDANGNVIMAGATNSPNFPLVPGKAFQSTDAGTYDFYVIKLTSAGVLLWSTYYGGSGEEQIGGVAADQNNGSIAFCGFTTSRDFPVGGNVLQATSSPFGDEGAVVLLDQNGVRSWATYYGGIGRDWARSVDIDGAGNVVVAGETTSSNLLMSASPFQRARAGGVDAFLLKLTPAGALVWSTYIGGGDEEGCKGVATDAGGGIMIAGGTTSIDLPVTLNAFQRTRGGGQDAWAARFDANGQPVWITYYGGTGTESATDIACDAQGNALFCGMTTGAGFPVSPAAIQPVFAGGSHDAFLVRIDPSGGRIWGTYYGGADQADYAYGVTVSGNGDIFVTGFTFSPTFPLTPDAYQTIPHFDRTAFVLQIDPSGARKWSSYYGSTGIGSGNEGYHIDADRFGGVFVAGRAYAPDLPGAERGFQPKSGGYVDAFIAKFGGFCPIYEPDVTPVTSLILCDGESATLSGAIGYQYYFWTPGNVPGREIVVDHADSFMLTVIDQNGCGGYARVVVEKAERPRPSITPRGALLICEGDSVLLDARAAGLVGYSWSSGDTTSSIWARAAGEYTVSVMDTNGCSGISGAVRVEVDPRPGKPPLPAGPIYICPENSVTLAATGYSRCLWSNGVTTPTLTVSSPGRYSVTVFNASGCSVGSDTVTVLHYPHPEPKIVVHGTRAICEGDSVDLEVTGGPFADDGIRWSNGARAARIRVGRAGVYSVTVRSADDCAGGPDTASVTVLPAPRAAIIGPEAVCADATSTYRVPDGRPSRYAWTLDGDGSMVSAADGQSVSVRWGGSGSGRLRLTVTDRLTGCTATTERAVTIGRELKPVIIADGPSTFCDGDSVALEAGFGMKSYRWSTGDTTAYIIVKAGGSYTVAVEDSSGCRGTSSPIEISVLSRPVPVITGTSKVCLNTEGSYSVADLPGGDYTWLVRGGVILAGEGTSTITVLWGSGPSGSVDMLEGAGLGLCQGSATRFDVEIGSKLEPVITPGGGLSLCEGDSVVLDAGEGYASYAWSTGDTSRRITVKSSGRFSVAVRGDGGCEGASKPVDVTVGPAPTVGITVLGPATLCSGDSVMLDAGASHAGYRWSTGETARIITVGRAGSYAVTVTGPGGCVATSAPVVIVVEERPTPVISGALKVCLSSTMSYATPDAAGHAYAWSTGGGTVVSGQGTSRIMVQWGSDTEGIIDLVETGAGGHCRTVAQRYHVRIGTELEPVITPGGHLDLCAGESIELDAGEGYARYEWSTGETTRRIVARSTGSYAVKVWDAGGCNGASYPVGVEVHPLPTVTIMPPGPVTIAAGDSVVLDAGAGHASYRWSSGESTRTITVKMAGSYGVAVSDPFGCGGSSPVVAVDVATATGPGGGAVIDLPVVEAVPGERLRVPLTLRESHDLPPSPLEFHARIRFRASLLAPTGSTPTGVVDGADRLLDLRGTLPEGTTRGPLVELELMALLGDTDIIPLKVESFRWSDTTITTSLRDGELHLKGLCIAGPTRLVGASGGFALKGVRPNPAGDRAVVEYELVENGPTRLEIVDMAGGIVGVVITGEGVPGRYGAEVDLSALPSGAYMLVLWTPTYHATAPLLIRR